MRSTKRGQRSREERRGIRLDQIVKRETEKWSETRVGERGNIVQVKE